MTKGTLTSFLVVTLALFSCKKETTKWDTDWSAPIAYGHLTIDDMIPVDNLETNSEGYLSLVIHESIFEFSLDTLIKLPDTTIVQKTAIGVPSLAVSPTFVLPDDYDQIYELGEIQLKRVIIESGHAEATIESPWPGKTKITFTFPNVTGPDGTFERVYYLDAGSEAAPSEVNDWIDMTMQDMDLIGVDVISYNTIGINVLIESNELSDSFIVTNTDSISFTFAFEDMIPRYAKGYFGQYYFSDTMAMSLPPMKKIVAGTIDIDSIAMKLTVKNGFNIVAQAKITKLTGFNNRTFTTVDLDFAEKNTTLNINPASGGLYDYVPSEYPIEINNANSNVIDIIEALIDSVEVGYELEINPFGNTTAGSDEFFPDSKMELFLDGEFPLNFSANDLTIQDTIDIDWIDAGNITPTEATVFLDYVNGFPIEADAIFYLLDENNNIIDSIIGTSPILSGTYLADTFLTTPYTGRIEFELNDTRMDNLELTKKMILRVAFNTDGDDKIKISPDTFFDFKMRSNLQIRVAL